ncbi:hypothetical protein E2C01_005573 [Portunus trituberculatus]|uniref:Uncharacterized protein n=1 Tax=Portunus trituberculatus TaxID=210409 RepID=A0A5B7CTX2_PORTR|nr:hypothetical protein [Portunus trituberculatus]
MPLHYLLYQTTSLSTAHQTPYHTLHQNMPHHS